MGTIIAPPVPAFYNNPQSIENLSKKQVMWAVSTKVNPAGDVFMLPNLSIDVLADARRLPNRNSPFAGAP